MNKDGGHRNGDKERGGARSIRFSVLVRRAGTPVMATLWGDPSKDHSFMQLVKERRVVTLMQSRAGKPDVATAGFHVEPSASYLIFPKPLELEEGTKIVGIKYDLISDETGASFGVPPKTAQPGGTSKKHSKKVRREVRKFKAEVKERFEQLRTIKVSAADAAEARRQISKMLEQEEPPLGLRKTGTKIGSVHAA